ncbi:helix-turn-helix domain-containing protein [Mangrovimicrobium sediminis]|nr:helix-turn-helix transcriptional regulator [Haliea sp. SAOS-164]
MPILKAWRMHLRLTEREVAQRMGISQYAYRELEQAPELRPNTRTRAADALGISDSQLIK